MSQTNNAAMMSAVQYIESNHITNYLDVIRVLMERAEKVSNNGSEKHRFVIDCYNQLYKDGHVVYRVSSTDGRSQAFPLDPATISIIIEAIVYITKTATDINKKTNCWSAFTGLFKKKSAVPTVPIADQPMASSSSAAPQRSSAHQAQSREW